MGLRRHTKAEEFAIAEAAERAAYQLIREAIPDLVRPAALRPHLTARQRSAVSDYKHAKARLDRARQAAHR